MVTGKPQKPCKEITQENQEFRDKVFSLVACIPAGRVASYGQLALLAGFPKNARKAGRLMHSAPSWVPCHRVVNSQGRTVPFWEEQRHLLAAEGVCFKANGCVNMKLYRYHFFDI